MMLNSAQNILTTLWPKLNLEIFKDFLEANPPSVHTTTQCNNGFLCWLAQKLDFNCREINALWNCDLSVGKFTHRGASESDHYAQNVFWRLDSDLSIEEILAE